MKCWKCNEPLSLNKEGRISFRETCEKCSTWLHCCKNCKNYFPGLSNHCKMPGTDPIADREKNNFCEEFKLLGKGTEKKFDPKEVERLLFGD